MAAGNPMMIAPIAIAMTSVRQRSRPLTTASVHSIRTYHVIVAIKGTIRNAHNSLERRG
jgi:hypothetical protein